MMMARAIIMMILSYHNIISYINIIDDVDNVLGEEIVDGKWDGCGS